MSRQQLARVGSALLILAVIPVNLYLVTWRFIDLRRAEPPYYMPVNTIAAYDYLETQVTGEDVVLSSLTVGQFVPALTGARAFLAHWAQTLDFFGKTDRVTAFFNADTDDAEREAILRDFSVDYVIYTPEEAALGDFDPAAASYLAEAYREGDTAVYEVLLDEVALAN
jgi:hypothetical protein